MNDDSDLDPRAVMVAERIRRTMTPIVPPSGLADRTVAFVQAADAMPSSQHAETPIFLGRRRADVLIAFAIGFVAFALGISGIQKMRSESAKANCQNQLRELYGSLSQYAETHHGRFPAVTQAGDFVDELSKAGVLNQMSVSCPADIETRKIGFAYTLGYRTNNGTVVGFRKPDPARNDDDGMPLVADFPTQSVAPQVGPYSPHGNGQNVLFAGGFVRFTTSPLVGLDGDDIYRNRNGIVAAGLTATDACLGRPTDQP